MINKQAIGVFDSGYGGLTVLRELVAQLPTHDFIYLGDNARAPYGTRSFEVIYEYTLQAVNELFNRGCELVILACNTASAKALRTIQQNDLPRIAPHKRVLGVIRPSIEFVSEQSKTGHVGVLATSGTVVSESYPIEFKKWSNGRISNCAQHACPMWVPIIENNEINTLGAQYFIARDLNVLLEKDPLIDQLILGCTHYPLLIEQIKKELGNRSINVVEQGKVVALSLVNYLQRHPDMDARISRNSTIEYLTTEQASLFESRAQNFLGKTIIAQTIHLS
ncbi:MAG: glutamate racemase [Mangrovibacterium sp.]